MVLGLLWCNLSYAEISNAIKKNLKKSCVASAVQSGAPKAVAKKYCACTAKYINDNMTTAEFIELENSLESLEREIEQKKRNA